MATALQYAQAGANAVLVEREQLHPVGVSRNHVAAEASTLGLRPGQWPPALITSTREGLPVRFDFVSLDRTPDGEVAGATYMAGLGTYMLTVVND